jgi:hypothetical protein
MKHLAFLCGVLATVAATPALAQDVTVDTFEGYVNQAALDLVWDTPNNANQAVTLMTSGGADGTPNWLQLTDGGFGFDATGTGLVSPPAGTYKLSFYYMNGQDEVEMGALQVFLAQDGINKITINLGSAEVTGWTKVESEVVALSGSPVNMIVKSANGAAMLYRSAFDQFILTPLASVPVVTAVWPDDRIFLSGTETITATATFGSETYTKAEFDIDGDNIIEHTDTTEPFEFAWNTTAAFNDTSGTKSLTVTITDSMGGTGSVTETYTIDNEFGGRESMVVNGDFSQWQDGTNFGSNVPVGWTTQLVSPNATFGPSTSSHSPEAGTCLQVRFAGPNNADNTDRYTLRTNAKVGRWRDMQTTWWGKGGFCRLYYFLSTDDGATFATTSQDAGLANDANWVFVVEAPPQNLAAMTDTTQVSLATHSLGISTGTRDAFWDDLTWEGNSIPAGSSVEGWNLY